MSSMDFKDRVVIVTGASLGIGRACALAFGKAGASVVVNYRSHPDQAEAVVREVREAGAKAIALQADVADQAAVERMVADTVSHFGRLDIAVSNAAYSDRELFYKADMAGFRRGGGCTMWGGGFFVGGGAAEGVGEGGGGGGWVGGSPRGR